MNIVLYTSEFEPITVLDIPLHVLEHLERHHRVRIPILDVNTTTRGPREILLELNYIPWLDGTQKPVVTTSQLELALELKPDWLTGQRAQVNQYQTLNTKLKQLLDRAIEQLKQARE